MRPNMLRPWRAQYEFRVRVPSNDPRSNHPTLTKKYFEIQGIRPLECPVSMLDFDSEVRELVELQIQFESSGIQLFDSDPEKRPAWSLDFYELVKSADNKIHAAHQEELARI